MAKASTDSSRGVSGNIFSGIQDSFTTQATPPAGFGDRRPAATFSLGNPKPDPARGVKGVWQDQAMPYALFCNDARLSRTYPTEADVWKLARRSGLVVDAEAEHEPQRPCPMLDNDYEIRRCRSEPEEDPDRNKADADRDTQIEFRLNG